VLSKALLTIRLTSRSATSLKDQKLLKKLRKGRSERRHLPKERKNRRQLIRRKGRLRR
jgi:hypothetical protein